MDMGEGLAQGEGHLEAVELPLEQHRDHVHRREGLPAASLQGLVQAFLVVARQGLDPPVQSSER
jgi:hypothetical protein